MTEAPAVREVLVCVGLGYTAAAFDAGSRPATVGMPDAAKDTFDPQNPTSAGL